MICLEVPFSDGLGGVKEYHAKWKRISKRVSELDYCIFSQYVGEDSNLVPEFVLHQVIEPIFFA